jgi:arylsulfatase A-like enzyme
MQHYGELVAMDRSIGRLRQRLRELDLADNTIVWFSSDNGGLPGIQPETVGGLRGNKGSLYEGGLRVPGIIEWPARIKPRVTDYPAVVMDIFPTIAQIVGLPESTMLQPQDGLSLVDVMDGAEKPRDRPIPFQCFGNTAVVDNQYKLLELGKQKKHFELYDLSIDPQEENNLYQSMPQLAAQMTEKLRQLQASIAASYAGKDYAAGKLIPGDPAPRSWTEVKDYRPYFEAWSKRPEYKSRLQMKVNP